MATERYKVERSFDLVVISDTVTNESFPWIYVDIDPIYDGLAEVVEAALNRAYEVGKEVASKTVAEIYNAGYADGKEGLYG